MGARALGMANAASCAGDEWAMFNNIGGLSKVSHLTAACSKYVIPSFKPFNRLAAVFAVPVKLGVAGAGFFRFGDDLYSEQLITVGYSNQFGIASLGVKMNYIQYHAEGFGTKSALAFSFGGIAELTPTFSIGAFADNINQPRLSSVTDERIPARFKVGTGFKLSEKVFATAELQKQSTDSPVVRAGLEYEVHKKFTARTGFNLNPQSAFGGIGFKLRKFKLDYAIQFHELLGAAHQATVIASLQKKK
ncbi:MAG TPA: hypothetical protein VGD40_05150 [Chryseosolibacter sp.]